MRREFGAVVLGAGVTLAGLTCVGPAASAADGAADWVWTYEDPATQPPDGEDVDMFYDTKQDKVFLFVSGDPNDDVPGETWSWDGSAWTRLATKNAPISRRGSALAYDEKRGYAVLYGGTRKSPQGFLQETWVFDGHDWTEATPPASPGNRFGHSMGYDPHLQKVILFGGKDTPDQQWLRQTWAWNGRTWTRVKTPDSPSPRYLAGMAFDRSRDSLVLFGGTGRGGTQQDTWSWDGSTWVELDLDSAPPARFWPAMASLDRRVAIMGGIQDGDALDDAWVLRDRGWVQLAGTGPDHRYNAATTFDRASGELVLFGGWGTGGNPTNQWTLARADKRSPIDD